MVSCLVRAIVRFDRHCCACWVLCLSVFSTGPSLANELVLLPGQSLSVEVGKDSHVLLTLSEEALMVSGPVGPDISVAFYEELLRFDQHIGIAQDINGNGWTDLMILDGVGYGGVNLF
ncbi:hypothetical protein [Halovulum sp. GXIMD14793]